MTFDKKYTLDKFSFFLKFPFRLCSERILELMVVEDISINMGTLIIFVITQLINVVH